jgi:hypothetical protein
MEDVTLLRQHAARALARSPDFARLLLDLGR